MKNVNMDYFELYTKQIFEYIISLVNYLVQNTL